MKIAVNTRVLIENRMEGVARYIYETLKRMVFDHPDDEFHFYFDRPYSEKFVFADNVVPHIIGPPARHPLLWYLWFEYSLPSAMKKEGIDVLYSGDTFMSLKTSVPTLLVCHDINYHHYPEHIKWSHLHFYRYFFPRYHRKASAIIAVSNATKKDIVNSYGLDDSAITVAYNDVPAGFKELEFSEKLEIRNKISGGKPYFIYVGSLHPRKNVDGVIKAYEAFRNSNDAEIKLVIYGRIAWKTSGIFNLYNNSAYKNDIVFVDNRIESVQNAMGAAECLCYVSFLEGFGIPILEAFHSGIPVITSNTSSMPEVAGDAALLVDPQNINEIAASMDRIINESDLKEDLIEKAEKTIERFNWQRSSEIIYSKIVEIAGTH
ncbi:MAG: glycosyltransferase family 4 protein [Saprospiraceae bacterium]|nr:glycosyltransferase family 4 protein [Bacteroidia bacterium]NNF22562.1 glycosyltransferase family 4 protein [Saprospiraceae bacterium]NNK90627.1 glycosyltransferase family 4 protein [Saprospiraceae bacterium]